MKRSKWKQSNVNVMGEFTSMQREPQRTVPGKSCLRSQNGKAQSLKIEEVQVACFGKPIKIHHERQRERDGDGGGWEVQMDGRTTCVSALSVCVGVCVCVTSAFPIHSVILCVLVAQSCLILCNPMDCSIPGSFVPGNSPGKLP